MRITSLLSMTFCVSLLSQEALQQNLAESSNEIELLDTAVIDTQKGFRIEAWMPLACEQLSSEQLQRQAQSTLGETLGWQAGISSGFYGQGAARPIIRGFDGFRVRMLQDSLGTLDVSASSPDHGLPIEPLLLENVDLLRGPAALLYGNAALGGAVNAHTRHWSRELPNRPISGATELRLESAAQSFAQATYLHWCRQDWVITATQSNRQANDYRLPAAARTRDYESKFRPVVNDPLLGASVPIENPKHRLRNSFHDSTSQSLGLSWLPKTLPFEAHAAIIHHDSQYGLPYLFGGDPNDLFGDSSLDLTQERFDTKFSYLPKGQWIDEIRWHFAYADYAHSENFIGRGKDHAFHFSDTQFQQNAWETRLDWTHQLSQNWRGITGLQVISQQLDPSFLSAPPLAESRFSNRYDSLNLAAFTAQTLQLHPFEITASVRYETQKIEDLSLAEFGFSQARRDESVSAALGIEWKKENFGALDQLKSSLQFSAIERLPSETERYAFWPNPAIQRFLIGGDLDGKPLPNEQSFGIDWGIQASIDSYTLKLNAFHYQIENFIFLQDLVGIGNQASYRETDARFSGFEFQGDSVLYEQAERKVSLSLMSDWIHAQNRSDDEALPRIPPWRIGTRLQFESLNYQAGLEIRHAFAQDRLQPSSDIVQGELATNDYTEVNFDLNRRFQLSDNRTLNLFFQIQNLLDAERRLNPSFLKDVAPLPGRNFVVGARLEF